MVQSSALQPSASIRRIATRAKDRQAQERPDAIASGSLAERAPNIPDLVRSMILECGNPAHALEFYYWSKKPGLRDALRTLAALSEESRSTIQTFLAMAQNPDAVVVAMGESGTLMLSSPDVSANYQAFRKAVA